MLGFLTRNGFGVADEAESADLIIVNTCGFIEPAIEESIEAILDMGNLKKEGAKGLIVTGCLYQRYGKRLREELPEVDAFVGCGELEKIVEACQSVLRGVRFAAVNVPEYLYDHNTPRVLVGRPNSVYVKIAEGCDNRCSYCTIPKIRGRYRSRSPESVVKEVRRLVRRGAKEINLIAQDSTYFGAPETGEERITHLLRELDRIRGKKWLRLLYAHPARITTAVARAIDDSRSICHYLDMPVQHVCDDILRAMRRKGSSDAIRRAVAIVREEIPDLSLRTTLMVGFPGETDKHFEKLLNFVREAKFDKLGVFKYSRESGTDAARLSRQVPEKIKQERYDVLMREQVFISHSINRSLIGRTLEAFVEGTDDSAPKRFVGRTYRDGPDTDGVVRIRCDTGTDAPVGEFVQVEITKADDYDLEGRLL